MSKYYCEDCQAEKRDLCICKKSKDKEDNSFDPSKWLCEFYGVNQRVEVKLL